MTIGRMGSLIIASAVMFAIPAWSQTQEYYLDQTHRASQRTVDVILREFRRVADSNEQYMIGKIDIKIHRRDPNLYNVYALMEHGKRSIHFSLGFIDGLSWISSAGAAAQVRGIPWNVVYEYIDFLAQYTHERTVDVRLSRPSRPFPSFGTFVGWSSAEWAQVISTSEFADMRDLLMLNGIAFVLGHEIGHHMLGHLDNSEQSTREEIQADDYGFELAMRADYSPLLAVVPFLFYSAMKGEMATIYQHGDIHPPPMCRAATLMRVGFNFHSNDSDFTSTLRANGQYETWLDLNRQFESQISRAIKAHWLICPE